MCTQSFLLRGLVQGQGVRPTIARLATEHTLAGFVCNTHEGVQIEVSGARDQIVHFANHVRRLPNAELCVVGEWVGNRFRGEFQIRESNAAGTLSTVVPPDLGVCKRCLQEVFSPLSRRYRYAFTTCTQCGPRYSILRRMPFDRENTSMASFAMCEECRREYEDPCDRRFHSQTNACAVCGPQCWSEDCRGDRTASGVDAIEWVGQRIRDGSIAAIKGVGGYQLVCDATHEEVVKRLRARKHRLTKPLPVMAGETSFVEAIAFLDQAELASLESMANPIVLLRSRHRSELAASIHPRLSDVGVMLPTTPLHSLLCSVIGRPVVVTSGNVHGAPIVFQKSSCDRSNNAESLASIADVWLHHDREIFRPIDDSVVRVVNSQEITLRCARGLSPLTISFPHREGSTAKDWIGVGGHQKVAMALATKKHLVLAPHIGDMDSEAVRQRFVDEMERLRSLYEIKSPGFVGDLHPDYSTRRQVTTMDREEVMVQHHHAHVAAAMFEHGLSGQQVLGFAFDGTGYGTDATVWGGEVLICDETTATRVAHLRTFRLPGGEAAIKEPWRVAMSLLSQCGLETERFGWSHRFDLASLGPAFELAMKQGPSCSSMGRLFDGVAAMMFPEAKFFYEGEAAMVLESVCDEAEQSHYAFAFEQGTPVVIDWRPVIRAISADCGRLPVGVIAMRFHRGVAMMMGEIARRYESLEPLLCGGVFQNRVLLTLLQEMNPKQGKPFRMPGRVPANDGGLSLGQVVVASAMERLVAKRQSEQVQRCV